jgi:hypothetical protein
MFLPPEKKKEKLKSRTLNVKKEEKAEINLLSCKAIKRFEDRKF